MNISPTTACKKNYPTMAAVATGAVMLTGCAPQLGGQVPYTPPTEQEQQTPQTEDSPKRTPQIVIGKARIVPHED